MKEKTSYKPRAKYLQKTYLLRQVVQCKQELFRLNKEENEDSD